MTNIDQDSVTYLGLTGFTHRRLPALCHYRFVTIQKTSQ
jgi:hypothetical protein